MHLYNKFKSTADLYPLQVAIQHGSRCTNYTELSSRVQGIALQLAAIGCKTGTVVGIYQESSIDYVAAMLAINALSASFLPLDPGQPLPRLLQVVTVVQPSIIVTDIANLSAAGELATACTREGFQLKIIDDSCELANNQLCLKLDEQAQDSLYFIFTSGSTGTPKVIKGSCQGIVHFIDWEVASFNLDVTSRTAQLAPIGFDVSFRDILVPLFCGGSVCIPPKGLKHNAEELLNWMNVSKVNTLHIVPSLFRILLLQLQQSDILATFPQQLNLICFAGEPLYYRDVINWKKLAGANAKLVNLYGPSETTLAKLFYIVDDMVAADSDIVPLGKPLPDTTFWVLNERGTPCRPGETGELHIQTKHPSYGYVTTSGLDDSRFINYKIDNGPMIRIYRTGDLVQLQQNVVVYRGRIDDQVKVNGNRVEPLEVENVLSKLNGIDQVVVTCKEDRGERQLCCFYHSFEGVNATVIKQYLNSTLPAYMHPVFFIPVAAFPLGVNGKVDKQQLLHLLPPSATPTSWQSDTETAIAAIWSDVLNIDGIGKDSAFTHIGGSSLKAIQIIARIKKQFDILITPMDFIQHPTIGELALIVDQRAQDRVGEDAKSILFYQS
jgi:amino acid adenylation domain-containing protein